MIFHNQLIFSAPEHKMLKVSYCDWYVFIVRPSSVISSNEIS